MSFPRQHTQGPWQIRFSEMNKNLASVTDNSRNPIAPCVGPQAEANARLIASAPTMFDYLTLLASRGNDEAHEIIKKIIGP